MTRESELRPPGETLEGAQAPEAAFEEESDHAIERVLAVVEANERELAFEAALESAEHSENEPGIVRSISDKINNVLTDARTAMWGSAAVLGLLAGMVTAERAPSRVVATKDPQGKVEKHHTDSDTELLVNYLGGAKLTQDQKLRLLSLGAAVIGRDKGVSANYTDSESEIVERTPLGRLPDLPEDPVLRDALMELIAKHGAPRIRISPLHGQRAFYLAGSDTAVIGLPQIWTDMELGVQVPSNEKPVEDLVSELAHADQTATDSWDYALRSVSDGVATQVRAVAQWIPTDAAREQLYKDPGSLEYDAHTSREPVLEKELQETYAALKSEEKTAP